MTDELAIDSIVDLLDRVAPGERDLEGFPHVTSCNNWLYAYFKDDGYYDGAVFAGVVSLKDKFYWIEGSTCSTGGCWMIDWGIEDSLELAMRHITQKQEGEE